MTDDFNASSVDGYHSVSTTRNSLTCFLKKRTRTWFLVNHAVLICCNACNISAVVHCVCVGACVCVCDSGCVQEVSVGDQEQDQDASTHQDERWRTWNFVAGRRRGIRSKKTRVAGIYDSIPPVSFVHILFEFLMGLKNQRPFTSGLESI